MLQVLNLRQFITSVFDRQDCKVIPGPLLLKNIEKVGELPENFVMIDVNASNSLSAYTF